LNFETGAIVDEAEGGKHCPGSGTQAGPESAEDLRLFQAIARLRSVFANLAIDAIRPGVDSPAQVADLLESLLPQKLNGLYAARAHFANGNDLLPNVQLLETLRKLSQGDQMAPNV
jgi:hypothetical protein